MNFKIITLAIIKKIENRIKIFSRTLETIKWQSRFEKEPNKNYNITSRHVIQYWTILTVLTVSSNIKIPLGHVKKYILIFGFCLPCCFPGRQLQNPWNFLCDKCLPVC